MNIVRAIKLAFSAPAAPGNAKALEREIDRRIVSRLSTGNVRLQMGLFSTREDIDEERKKARSYNFDD